MMMANRPGQTPLIPAPPPSPTRHVSVWLLEPATRITGVAVPERVLGATRATEFLHIDEPAVISVTLPGGKEVTLPTKTAFVTTKGDGKPRGAYVVDVALLPLPAAVPFPEAKAGLRRLLREMAIEPDPAMRKKMDSWPEVGGDYTYRTRMKLDASCDLEVDVKSVPGDDGWLHFLVINLAADVDARRMLWDPTFRPAARPPAGESGGK